MSHRLQDYTDEKTGAVLRLDTSTKQIIEFEVEGVRESVTIELGFEQAKRMAEQLGAWVGYHLVDRPSE